MSLGGKLVLSPRLQPASWFQIKDVLCLPEDRLKYCPFLLDHPYVTANYICCIIPSYCTKLSIKSCLKVTAWFQLCWVELRKDSVSTLGMQGPKESTQLAQQ